MACERLVLCLVLVFLDSFGLFVEAEIYYNPDNNKTCGLIFLGVNVPPQILNNEDHEKDTIINAGENFTLFCQGSKPLKWIYPKTSDRPECKFETDKSQSPHNNIYTHHTALYITDISYRCVGYYQCVYEDAGEIFSEDLSDKIYLYVNDSDHLSVGQEVLYIHAYQNQETTIPCRPTAPDIEVQLTNIYEGEINSTFDPKTGFTLNITDFSYEAQYYCHFERPKDQKDYELILFISVISPKPFLNLPYIEDVKNNHTDVGEDLWLQCYLQEDSNWIRFTWVTPRGNFTSEDKFVTNDKTTKHNGEPYLMSELKIPNVNLNDAGYYSCIVNDKQNRKTNYDVYVSVNDINDCYIQIREENDENTIEVEAGQDAQWSLKINAHPEPKLTWFDNHEIEIENNRKFFKDFSLGAVFGIKNATLKDAGSYRVHGLSSRNFQTKSCPKEYDYTLKLIVYDKPTISLESKEIYVYNETAKITCSATGNDIPIIEWQYKECLEEQCPFEKVDGENIDSNEEFKTTSLLPIMSLHEGAVRCIANNRFGMDASTTQFYISDVPDGFSIFDFGKDAIIQKNASLTEVTVATEETLTFTCAVCSKISRQVDLFFNNQLLQNKDRYDIQVFPNNMSDKTIFSLVNAKPTDSGLYSCRIKNFHNKYEYKNVSFIVKDPEPPIIWSSNLNKDIEIEYPNMPYDLFCNYTGIPKATIEWYKNKEPLQLSKRIIMEDDGKTLRFLKSQVSDEATYSCEVSNKMGIVFREAALKFKVKPVSVAIYYYITGFIGLLLIAALIYILIKKRKERELRRELKLLGLENFHNGNPENLNPELGIDDQAELLPYNKKWEFPIEQLKLGKQLGSGAFGVVMKGQARGIIDGEEKTTVAVKMVKKNADQTYIKALASELKIMVHLGKHINVVNLLGACTKNVAKRELLVIVEFCRFGNLQNYLYKHRDTYINQVDPISGKIDYNIGSDILERSYSVSSENGNNSVTTSHSMQDYREKENAAAISAATQMTSLSQSDDNVLLSNNSVQPEWRSNYRGDYRGNVKPVSTRDLVAWSFQVARGMEYLASRKVLHGDLAARNILLADDNVVKICDFGLAKTMYNDNNYKKKGNSPLPIKWMAIESIRDRIFSTQSDAWSFGIVLWELFSLAKTPYPGMEADERLYYKLVEGYRMDPPAYAPREIATMMEDCWHSKPLDRPSFTKLTEKMGSLLEDSVRKHYIDLNDPYLVINTQKLEGDDYLAMLSPPSFDVLSTPPPHYVNEGVLPSPHSPSGSMQPDGYLFMGGKAIFSPRAQDDEVFDFTGGKRRKNEVNKESQELRPMLNSHNESDSETGYLTPITPINSVSNPSYHAPPKINPESPVKKKKELLRTPDNYVNMPQYKNFVNSSLKENNEKPAVIVDLSGKKERAHYINNDWDSIDV